MTRQDSGSSVRVAAASGEIAPSQGVDRLPEAMMARDDDEYEFELD